METLEKVRNKLTQINTPERRRSVVFIVEFRHISNFFLAILLLTLCMLYLFAGLKVLIGVCR